MKARMLIKVGLKILKKIRGRNRSTLTQEFQVPKMEETWTLWGLGFPLHKLYPYSLYRWGFLHTRRCNDGWCAFNAWKLWNVERTDYWVWFVFWFYLFRFTGENTLLCRCSWWWWRGRQQSLWYSYSWKQNQTTETSACGTDPILQNTWDWSQDFKYTCPSWNTQTHQ